MYYNGTGINDSATIVAKASDNIANGAFKAVKLTATGIALAAAGEAAVGILIPETESPRMDDAVTVQVKDIGLVMTGAAVDAGDLLAADANGKLVKATEGQFIIAQALEAAADTDAVISAQICKAGYAPAAAVDDDI